MNPKIRIDVFARISKSKKGLKELATILNRLSKQYKKLTDVASVQDKERERQHKKEIELLKQKGQQELENLKSANRMKEEAAKEENRRQKEQRQKEEANEKARLKAIENEEKAKEKAAEKSKKEAEDLAKAAEAAAKKAKKEAEDLAKAEEAAAKKAKKEADDLAKAEEAAAKKAKKEAEDLAKAKESAAKKAKKEAEDLAKLEERAAKKAKKAAEDLAKAEEAAAKKAKKEVDDLAKAKERSEKAAAKAIEKREKAEEKASKQARSNLMKEIRAADQRIKQREKEIQLIKERQARERFERRAALGALGLVGAGQLSNFGFFGEQVIRDVVEGAASIERASDSFRALLGSADAAADAISRIRNIALLPGIEEEQARSSLQQLISYNFEITQADLLTREFGNATALAKGGAHALGEVLKQVGQASRRNKFEQQELNALIEYAPTLYKSWEKYLGQAITSGKQFTEATIAMSGSVKQFVIDATEFARTDAPRAGAETLANEFSNLRNQINFARQDLGQQFIPEIRSLSSLLSILVRKFNDLNPGLKKFSGYVFALTTVGAKAADPILQMVSAVSLASIALGGKAGFIALIAKGGPLLIALGIAATAIISFAKVWYDTRKAINATKDAVMEFDKAMAEAKSVEDSKKAVEGLIDAYKEIRQSLVERLGFKNLDQVLGASENQFRGTAKKIRDEIFEITGKIGDMETVLLSLANTTDQEFAERTIGTLQDSLIDLNEDLKTTKEEIAGLEEQLAGAGPGNRDVLELQLNNLRKEASNTEAQIKATTQGIENLKKSLQPRVTGDFQATAPTADTSRANINTGTRRSITGIATPTPDDIVKQQESFLKKQGTVEEKIEQEQKRKIDKIRESRFKTIQDNLQEQRRLYMRELEFELEGEREKLEKILGNQAISIRARKQAVAEFQMFLDHVNEERYFTDRESSMDLVEAQINDDIRQKAAAQEVAEYEKQLNNEVTDNVRKNLQIRIALAKQEAAERKAAKAKAKAEEEKERSEQLDAIDKVNSHFTVTMLEHQAMIANLEAQWAKYYSYINQLNFESTEQILASLAAIAAQIIRDIFLTQALRHLASGDLIGTAVFAGAAIAAEAGGQYIQKEAQSKGSDSTQGFLNRSKVFHSTQNDQRLKRSVSKELGGERAQMEMAQIQRQNGIDASNIIVDAIRESGLSQVVSGQEGDGRPLIIQFQVNDRVIQEMEVRKTELEEQRAL